VDELEARDEQHKPAGGARGGRERGGGQERGGRRGSRGLRGAHDPQVASVKSWMEWGQYVQVRRPYSISHVSPSLTHIHIHTHTLSL
jgi:hypothetical protein